MSISIYLAFNVQTRQTMFTQQAEVDKMWPRSDCLMTAWTNQTESDLFKFRFGPLSYVVLNQIHIRFFENGTSVWTAMWPISEFNATLMSLYINITHNFAQANGRGSCLRGCIVTGLYLNAYQEKTLTSVASMFITDFFSLPTFVHSVLRVFFFASQSLHGHDQYTLESDPGHILRDNVV